MHHKLQNKSLTMTEFFTGFIHDINLYMFDKQDDKRRMVPVIILLQSTSSISLAFTFDAHHFMQLNFSCLQGPLPSSISPQCWNLSRTAEYFNIWLQSWLIRHYHLLPLG